MNTSYLKVVEALNRLVDFKDRNTVAAVAVAWHVASELSLPSGEVAAPAMHFFNTYAKDVRTKVSYMNETITMDAKYCLEMIQKFWLLRYYTAFPVSRKEALAVFLSSGQCSVGFFSCAFSEAKLFSQAERTLLNTHAEALLRLNVIIAESEDEVA